jgi:two-component system OmpR family sensor kinase
LSIRWRLTLWFSLIFLVILIISGIVLNTLLRTYLYHDVDLNLQNYSARVHGTIHGNNDGPLDYNIIHSSLPPINEFSSPGIYIQIIDSDGTVIVKSDNLINQDLPLSTSLIQKGLSGDTAIQTVAAGDNANLRIMVSTLFTIDQTLILEVAQSLKPVDTALRQVRLALFGGAFLALLLTVVLGAVVIRQTLEPVEVITRTARNIEESSNLERRVGYQGPPDEIGRLAKTFDHMIERLDKVFKSQKNFIADASHEIRTPLTVIKGNLDLLKRNISSADRQESLQAIESETRRLTKIGQDLLLLADVESGQNFKMEPVLLKELVTEEFQRVQLAAADRSLILGRVEDLVVTGDTYKLGQVISNLVDNAIKYTSEKGIITLSLFRDGFWARLEVSDTGIGIDAPDIPHLFERFYRVDKGRSRTAGGTGLGLAIASGIVQQHGGRITVSSVPGNGSTFTVWLKLKIT